VIILFGIDFSRNQKLALFTLIGLAVIGLSLPRMRNLMNGSSDGIVIREPGQDGSVNITASGSDAMPNPNSKDAGKVVFHVAGCVRKPGVYSLPEGERVVNAIGTAGGATQDADLDSLNLAAKIEDGSKIVVPSRNIAASGRSIALVASGGFGRKSSTNMQSSGSDKLRTPGEGVVHINSADITELQRLPGVGPSTAQKISDYRSQSGGFKTPEQIMDVKGIGPKKYEKMRPFVTL